MRSSPRVQRVIRPLIAYRFLLSIGLSAACGIILNALLPVHHADAMLRLMEMERPDIVRGLVMAHQVFLYSTPFIVNKVVTTARSRSSSKR